MTTNSCAVPTCNTGRKSVKEKCSVFKVPSKRELREKWIAAIPGIFYLKSSQFVCEKHFPERFIRRKWIKYDANGRIVAEAPYSRVRLDPSAVPSEFDNINEVGNLNVADGFIERHNRKEHNYCVTKETPTFEAESTPVAVAIETPSSSDHDPIERSSIQDVSINEMALDPVMNDSAEPMQDEPIQDDRAPETSGCKFNFSEVTLSCTTEGRTESILIPKPWTVSELSTDNAAVLFSYVTPKVDNGENVPVIQRLVKLDPNKQLRYFVYGRVVHECKLLQVLDSIDLLPQALENFKNMNLCNGLGSINEHHLSLNSVFKDGVDYWRDRDCTLISKWKRCACCIKMRAVVLKRESRSKTEKSLKRVHQASNPIDQRKINALRKRNERIRRIQQRTRKRIHLLEGSLKEKAAEIALIRNQTLINRCSKLKIPATQQTALQEIIAAAGKNGKNRRYGEQWIMLCLLMNIRSPSFYEYLRNNNVLPLPCSRTIRDYFSLVDLKCGFDKDFAKLL
ncbi:uncharacterized protein LOC124297541 [Neodiprion virginianus]|uniref:uncharacterized protein LOC124297541 n=1 Tax=Neodiprion virginianus TaxID=2961670 RepID=UPI001EE744BE|nr:uncharacterized protein LOC124297541 [Neodiprion virginianus]